MRVLCVTPNPSVDRIVTVPGFAVGGVWRAGSVHTVCGGKGVNVARAVLRLGHQALCAGPIGGHAGRFAAEQATAEGLTARWTRTVSETRTCVIIVHDGGSTVINEPGSVPAPPDWRHFVGDVADAARGADVITISGSLPPGLPAGAIAALVAGAQRAGKPVWIDTSGDALGDAVGAGLGAIKINGPEAAALLGQAIDDVAEAAAAARAIRERGPCAVAITLGAAGAVMVADDGVWYAAPPPIAAVNPTGSGDSFLAGLVTAPDDDLPGTLCWAVATGAAEAMQPMAGALEPIDVKRIAAKTEVSLLSA